jgi:hypothetical protein
VFFNQNAPKTQLCPVCEAPATFSALAVVNPWIRELGVKERLSRYFICGGCYTGFFSKRYSSEEMESIYGDYRGPRYMITRSKWEPWYSNAYNSSHDSESWVQSRKKLISSFILANGSTSQYEIVVDIGGNRGEYIPDYAKQKYLLDISRRAVIKEVKRIKSLDELNSIELIMYAHILEHVKNPFKELQKLLIASKNVYVEVPYGVPAINGKRKSKLKLIVQLVRSTTPNLWKWKTSPAAGRFVKQNKILTQSEHLTFFSEESMKQLALRLDANVSVQRTTIATPDSKSAEVLQCLFSQKAI